MSKGEANDMTNNMAGTQALTPGNSQNAYLTLDRGITGSNQPN